MTDELTSRHSDHAKYICLFKSPHAHAHHTYTRMRVLNIAALVAHSVAAVACIGMHIACGFGLDTFQDLASAPRSNATAGFGLYGDLLDGSCFLPDANSVNCNRRGLPLYQDAGKFTRWHPLALLGHFELISVAFSLFHVRPCAWRWSAGLAALGAAIFLPYTSGAAALGELFVMVAGTVAAAAVFFSMRHWPDPDGATRVALRYAEYAITAPELFVAVLCLFIVEPPAFMPLLGLALICMCNVGGLQMHWGLSAAREPDTMGARDYEEGENDLRALRVPMSWLPRQPASSSNHSMEKGSDWGKSIGLIECGLLDTWLLYAAAMSLVAYQGQLLLLTAPPWYVTASAWFLLLSYTSFGIWATLCYAVGWCDATLDAGFALLSPMAKVGIVGMLAFAFAFQSACLKR